MGNRSVVKEIDDWAELFMAIFWIIGAFFAVMAYLMLSWPGVVVVNVPIVIKLMRTIDRIRGSAR